MNLVGRKDRVPVTTVAAIARPSWDLLRLPVLGSFLRWRWSRIVMGMPLLIVSLVMIAHAFWGPAMAPKNLAALLTWVHFRGLVVAVILLAGNWFCMACPFMVPRELARRLWTPRFDWPSWLRGKWLATALFVAVLFVYELYDLFASPYWTGVLIAGYFAAALIVDGLFKRASFCKHVCPVGQFNFVSATMAPLEVAVRDHDTCTTCKTKDCIRGTAAEHVDSEQLHQIAKTPLQRGCELDLYQPRKVGNLDCTFCLDCVYACPHDNVGMMLRVPGEELVAEGSRSGLGVISRRFDLTVLMVVFTFGALLNAFAMVSPVHELERWVAEATGLTVEWPILGAIFVVALVIEPVVLLGFAAGLSRRWITATKSTWEVVNHFIRSLVPLGFGVWLAHYGFHFLTGFLTVIPVSQHAVKGATGSALLGSPMWSLGGLPESVVYPLEIGFLAMGLLGSLWVSWQLAASLESRAVFGVFWPWGVLHLTLFVTAVWIMNQPMDMRGTFLGAS